MSEKKQKIIDNPNNFVNEDDIMKEDLKTEYILDDSDNKYTGVTSIMKGILAYHKFPTLLNKCIGANKNINSFADFNNGEWSYTALDLAIYHFDTLLKSDICVLELLLNNHAMIFNDTISLAIKSTSPKKLDILKLLLVQYIFNHSRTIDLGKRFIVGDKCLDYFDILIQMKTNDVELFKLLVIRGYKYVDSYMPIDTVDYILESSFRNDCPWKSDYSKLYRVFKEYYPINYDLVKYFIELGTNAHKCLVDIYNNGYSSGEQIDTLKVMQEIICAMSPD
jgi:hypothetical protein